jgi:hypothetical protein
MAEHNPLARSAQASSRNTSKSKCSPGEPPWLLISRMRFKHVAAALDFRYHGVLLPDDDAGRDDLALLLCLAAAANPCKDWVLDHVVHSRAPWLPQSDAQALIGAAIDSPFLTAQYIGQRLGLTTAERKLLRVWQIAAIDDPDGDARRARRRETDRARKARKARGAGVPTREQYLAGCWSRLRPWEAQGIRKRTWERRRAKQAVVASPSALNLSSLTQRKDLRHQTAGQAATTYRVSLQNLVMGAMVLALC